MLNTTWHAIKIKLTRTILIIIYDNNLKNKQTGMHCLGTLIESLITKRQLTLCFCAADQTIDKHYLRIREFFFCLAREVIFCDVFS